MIRPWGGKQFIHVVTVYGFPRANEGGEAYTENEDFLANVFAEADSLGDVPVVVCGDFNVTVEKSQQLSQRLLDGSWVDAASAVAMARGPEPEATYVHKDSSSRIDMFFLNSAAAQMIEDLEVLAVPEGGIKRHRPVCLTLRPTPSRGKALATASVKRCPKATGVA